MTTITLDGLAVAPRAPASAKSASPARPSLGRRIWDGLTEVGRRRAEREIAAYIEMRGGRITDSLERSIERYCETRGLR